MGGRRPFSRQISWLLVRHARNITLFLVGGVGGYTAARLWDENR